MRIIIEMNCHHCSGGWGRDGDSVYPVGMSFFRGYLLPVVLS